MAGGDQPGGRMAGRQRIEDIEDAFPRDMENRCQVPGGDQVRDDLGATAQVRSPYGKTDLTLIGLSPESGHCILHAVTHFGA